MKRYDYREYKMLKKAKDYTVGIIRNDFICEKLSGFCNIPVYYLITKEEFDSFGEWDKNKYNEIVNREKVAGYN